jgi:hypothetical protein
VTSFEVPAHPSCGNNNDEFQRLDVLCSDQHKRTGEAENRERNSTRTPLHHATHNESGVSAAHVELGKRPWEDVYLDCPDQSHTFQKKSRETKGDLEGMFFSCGPL